MPNFDVASVMPPVRSTAPAKRAALGSAALNINAAEFRPSFAAAPAPVQAPPPYAQQHAPDAWSHMGFAGGDEDAGQEWPANHWGAYVEQARTLYAHVSSCSITSASCGAAVRLLLKTAVSWVAWQASR